MKTIITFLIAIFLTSAVANAAKLYGTFYYEPDTDRYFTTAQSTFSIRPIENPKYLDRIEVSIDNGDFQAYSSQIKFDQEGLHLIRFRASDPVLNWSPMQSFRVYVDQSPPKTIVRWQGKSYEKDSRTFVSPDSTLSLSSQDNLSGVAKLLSQTGEKTSEISSNAKFAREGEYNLKVAAVDQVGNREEWVNVPFVVDASAPQTRAEIQGFFYKVKNLMFVNSGSRIALESQDSLSGIDTIEFQINSGPITTYREPIPPMGQEMTLKFRAVDHVGNAEAWKSLVIQQDTHPPRLAVEIKGKHIFSTGKVFGVPGLAITWSAQDADSGLAEVSVAQDGTNFQVATGREIRFDRPGEYRVAVRARDQVGNLEESNPYIIAIDQSGPVSELKTTNPWIEKEGVFVTGTPNRIEISARDEGAGLDHIEVSSDGRNFTTMKESLDVSQWRSDAQAFYYRAVDRLGNAETPHKIIVAVRTEGPKVDLFVEGENLPQVPLSQLRSLKAGQKNVREPATLEEADPVEKPKPPEKAEKKNKKDKKKPKNSKKKKDKHS